LWEIDAPEAESRHENIDAVAERFVIQEIDRSFDSFRTLGVGPANRHLGMSFVDGHFQRRMRHH